MIFKIDYRMDDKPENMDENTYIDLCYKHFCSAYINQIKNKLEFKSSKLQIDNPHKNDKEDKEKIDIISFEMKMVKPIHHKNIKKDLIKPPINNMNNTNKIRKHNKQKKQER